MWLLTLFIVSDWVALVDCNNFFVSCERVFRPDLWDRPVVVLSNNDGCVIARSQEVKAMGVPMGAPYFKYQKLFSAHNVETFSSNFSLYGDMSSRVMKVLYELSHDVSVYSIDEAFLRPPFMDSISDWAKEVSSYVRKCTGIPVSVGIARTKTLAKVANEVAKKNRLGDVVLFPYQEEAYLRTLDVSDVWGVGRQSAKKLRSFSIYSAYDFMQAPSRFVSKELKLPGLKTQTELKGQSCWEFHDGPIHRQSIVSTRSFGSKIVTLKGLKGALANNIMTGTRKLRRQGLYAHAMSLFIQTSPFSSEPYYQSVSFNFVEPTQDSLVCLDIYESLLESIFKSDLIYSRSGVGFYGLTNKPQCQMNLFSSSQRVGNSKLMHAIDSINERFGNRMVSPAILSRDKELWEMSQSKKSFSYLSDWDELPIVYC